LVAEFDEKHLYNMKKNRILFGTLASAIVAVAFITLPTTQNGVYQPRENQKSTATPEGAFDFYSKIRSNVSTGNVEHEDWVRAKNEFANNVYVDRAVLGWANDGPSNVGGRTRAILIDKDNPTHLFAGSVTGGLFESNNGGNTWSRVLGLDANLSISSMCMTDDGKIYVATGHKAEVPTLATQQNNNNTGAMGKGIYVSSNDGSSFTMITGTDAYTFVNEVVAKGNDVFAATNEGLKKISGSNITQVASLTGECKALAIQEDVILTNVDDDTYLSTNGGASFSVVSGSVLPTLQTGGRVEYAISDTKLGGSYYAYAIMSTPIGLLKGVYKSTNNGSTWTEIAPENTGAVGAFGPLLGLGNYALAISVYPGDPESILIGGINIYSKTENGNWEQKSNGFVSPTFSFYVHMDIHEFQWNSNGTLYIGNDGGITYSIDQAASFVEANRNYGVTQFYTVSVAPNARIIGGTQDNGSLANFHDNAFYNDFDRLSIGDAFDCAISYINPNIFFISNYNNSFFRTGDGGVSINPLDLGAYYQSFGTEPSFSQLELYENPNDLNSEDSILYYHYDTTYNAGDLVEVNSQTSGAIIDFVTPIQLLLQDTLHYDPAATTQDTLIVTDSIAGVAQTLNINLVNSYTFINTSQAPTIDVGDSLYINANTDDTIIVKAIVMQDHYWGTNSARPGVLVDMGENLVTYNVHWDTVMVQDVYQSWLAVGKGDGRGVYLTREALRLGRTFKAEEKGMFIMAGQGMTGLVSTMEFSHDGNHLFIGTETGEVWRLSGIGSIYSPDLTEGGPIGSSLDTELNFLNGNTATTFTLIANFGQFVTNIATDKQDVDHVIVTLGQFGGTTDKIQETTNATGMATFTGIDAGLQSNFSQKIPVYSVVIDRNNANTILVGTDFGVWQSTNGGTAWENVSGEYGNVPVYEMIQAWRTWNEGNYIPGRIYIATHGAGIWHTDDYLGTIEAQDNLAKQDFVSELIIYPNPVTSVGNIAFNLNSDSDVNINVYDLSGRVVRTISRNNLNAGDNIISINAENLPNGTYIVQLTAGNMIKTTKFIKQ